MKATPTRNYKFCACAPQCIISEIRLMSVSVCFLLWQLLSYMYTFDFAMIVLLNPPFLFYTLSS